MGSLYTEKTAKAVKSRYMHQQKLMQPGSQVLSPTRRDGQERTLGTRLQSMQIASEPQNIHGSTLKTPVQI